MVSGILTSASLEPVLVSEGREGVRHHLHELQCRTFVVVPTLERFYESLEGPAEFLISSFGLARCHRNGEAAETYSAKDRSDLAHDGDALR